MGEPAAGRTGTAEVVPLGAATQPAAGGQSEAARAVKNASILGSALLGTWAVAIAIRLALPRLLGPTLFGTLYFAEYFAATFFVLISLGVDNYIRKEVATRPAHASDFFGGLLTVRVIGGFVLVGVMAATLWATGRRGLALQLAVLFGFAQILFTTNVTYASLLQAVGEVRELARLNVVAKLIWGGGIAGGLAAGLPVTVVPAALLVSEAVKTTVLVRLARRHLGLALTLRLRATFGVIVASLPWYVAGLARTVYDKVDVTMITFMVGEREAGWYGAAGSLTGVTLLLLPLIVAVVLPSSSKAAVEGPAVLERFIHGTLRLTTALSVPITLMLLLGASFAVRTLFGAEYLPGIPALRILGITFVFTYVATIASVYLYQLDKVWSVAWISLTALAFNPLANYVLIAWGHQRFGPGGGGTGAALATLLTEVLAVALMHLAAGRRSVVPAIVPPLMRAVAAALVVVGVHLLLAPLGNWRLIVDGLAYGVLAFAFGAVRPADLNDLRRLLRRDGAPR